MKPQAQPFDECSNLVLPWCQDSRQYTLHRDKVIQHIGKPFLRIVARLELHFQLLHNHGNSHAHLQVSKVLASTIGGSRGEWNESGLVVNKFILAGKDFGFIFRATLLREPSFREERIGEGGKASRVPMDDICRDERVVAFGNEAIIKEQRLVIYNGRVGGPRMGSRIKRTKTQLSSHRFLDRVYVVIHQGLGEEAGGSHFCVGFFD